MLTLKRILAGLAALLMSTGLAAANGREATFHYAGGMTILPERGVIALDWRIAVLDPELTEVTFLLNPALGEAEVSGSDVLSVNAAAMENFAGGIMAYTITLAPAVEGRDRVIAMRYGGELLRDGIQNDINTVDSEKVELTVDSFWMPFDRRFSSLVTAELDIAIAGDWSGVGIESATRTAGGFRIVQERPALDVAFTLMSRFERVETEDYVVYDLRTEPGADLTPLIAALESCTGYLNALAGEAGTLPRAAVTVTERNSGGYSRATLIALTDIADTEPESLTQFICHELGHYWSSGNPMTVENWLNESFADYSGLMGMRAAHGEAVFDARLQRYRAQLEGADSPLPPVWTPETVERPPYLIAYRKGPLVLAALEEAIGRERFARLMQRYMEDAIATTPDLLAALEEVAGPGARADFEAVLAE